MGEAGRSRSCTGAIRGFVCAVFFGFLWFSLMLSLVLSLVSFSLSSGIVRAPRHTGW